ncbi:MAG: nucleotide exchange factor GrpE [Patescibacteria group bacterium]
MSDNLSEQQLNHQSADQVKASQVKSPAPESVDYQKQAEEYLALCQRARADYQNLKKETEQKLASLALYANKEILLELLPLVDYFKHAFKNLPPTLKGEEWAEGIRHIQSKLEQVLAYFGVKEMEVINEPFDPQLHEAVGEVEGQDKERGTIVEEVRTGFRWHDKVLQAARVRIAKG